jgi:KaiC/GvpD/RAD55 family RecA-like ATPase
MGDNVVEIKIIGSGISETGAQFEGLSDNAVEALNDIASSAGAAASALGDSAGEIDGYASSFVEAGDLLADAGDKARTAGEKAHEAGIEWGELGEKLLEVGSELGLTIGVLEGLKEAVAIDADIQKAQIAMTSLTGSAGKANEVIEQMEKLAKDDAIAFPELLPAAQRMVAVGFALDDIMPAMDAAANASWALGTSIDSVSARMEGMALAGMAGGRQLKALGLNSEDLARVMGVSTNQVAEAFKGLDVDQRLEVLTIAMQKFAGTSKAESAGLAGQWIEVKNQWHEAFGAIGKDIEPLVSGLERVAKAAGWAAEMLAKAPGLGIQPGERGKALSGWDMTQGTAPASGEKTEEQKAAERKAAIAAALELDKGALAKKRQEFLTSYDEQLADMRAFHEVSKEEELKFRQDELAAAKAKGPGFAPVAHTVSNQVGNLSQEVDKQHDAAMAKDEIDASKAQLAADMAVGEAATKLQEEDAKLDAANLRLAEANERYAARQTAAAKKHADAVIALDRIVEEGQLRHAQAIEGIDDDAAQERLDRGEISKTEYLRIKQEEIDKAYRMEVDAIAAERALLKSTTTDPDQLAKGNATLDNRGQAAKDKQTSQTGANKKNELDAQKQQALQYIDPIVGAFSKGIEGMLSGTERFGTAWRNMTKEMLSGTIGALVQIGAKHAETALANEAIHLLTEAGILKATVASQATADAAKVSGTVATSDLEIAASAAVAAAATFASIAAIPIVGPFLAPPAAAASYGTVMGMMALSAEGGADLPNYNTLGFLHPREMVLPAAHADVIRSLAAGGRGSSSSSNVNVGSVNYKGAQMPEKHFAAMAKRIQRNSNK